MAKRRLIFDSLKKIIGRTFRAGTTTRAVIGSNSGSGGSGSGKSGPSRSGSRTGKNAEAAASAAAAGAGAGGSDDLVGGDTKAFGGAGSGSGGSGGKKTGLGLNPDSVAYKWGTYVFSWGAGYQGQLGRKFERYAKKYAMTPEIVKVNLAVRQCAAGALHSALVTDEGRVWTWGDGRQEQLGYTPKAYTNQTEPTEIEGLLHRSTIVKVACGAGHTLCLDDQGRIHVFGTNRFGQLGTLDKQVKKVPFCVRDAKYFGNQVAPRFEEIGCGENHSVAIASTGDVYAWGANKHGQLGLGDTADKVHPTPLTNFRKKTVGLACGSIHTVYITADGELYVCGFGEHFYPKSDKKDEQNFYYEPTVIPFPGGDRIKQASCGQNHILALNLNGDVYSWGSGDYGQLGHGVRPRSHGAHVYLDAPRMVLEGKAIKQVACGRYHSVALNAWGILYSWGCGENGQLGHDSDENVYVPRVVEANIGTVVGQVACGEHHTVALTSTRWDKVNADVTDWLRGEREEYELKLEKTNRATHTHGLLAKDLGRIAELMTTKKDGWSRTKRDAVVREQHENAAHIAAIDKKSAILDRLKREVATTAGPGGQPTKQWMTTGVPDHMVNAAGGGAASARGGAAGFEAVGGAGGAGQSGAAGYGDEKRDTPSPPIEGDFDDRRNRRTSQSAAAQSEQYSAGHPHAYLMTNAGGAAGPTPPTGGLRPRPPAMPRPGAASSSTQQLAFYPQPPGAGLSSTAPQTLPRLATPQGSRADQPQALLMGGSGGGGGGGAGGLLNLSLTELSPRSAQSRANFLKESSAMVGRLKTEIAAKITASSDNQLKAKLAWVHGFRKEYDALRALTIQREKEVAALIRGAKFLRNGNDLYAESKDDQSDHKTVLEMKLNTVHINIQEAKVNEANYKNTIKYLKEEELERHKRIDALRRQVQDTDVWTRKVNEQKILWNDHRLRAEQELANFSYEVGGFRGFMDAQLGKMHAVTSSTNARKAEREEVKTKKHKKEKEKIHQRIERLTLEMDAKTLEAGQMGTALENVYERLRFFEKRFQQIAAATGLTDPDAIINKFLLKEEMRAELAHARDQKLAVIEARTHERAQLIAEMELAREQYRDSKWKDVDQWEERYRTLDAHATKQQIETERLNQRLAFFQEGLVTLLNALPPLPSQQQHTTAAGAGAAVDEHSAQLAQMHRDQAWPPAPERTLDILGLLETRLSELAAIVNIGPMENVPSAAADGYHESDDDDTDAAAVAAANASVDAALEADRRRAVEKKEKLSLGAMAVSAMANKNQRFADAVGAPGPNTTPGRPSSSSAAAGNATPPTNSGSGGVSARNPPTGTVAASFGAPPSTAPNA